MAWDPKRGSYRSKGDKLKDAVQGFAGGATQGLMMNMMMGGQGSQEEEACKLRQLNGEKVAWDEKTKQCAPTLGRAAQDPNAPGVQRRSDSVMPSVGQDAMNAFMAATNKFSGGSR
jgi:hypothetical protein